MKIAMIGNLDSCLYVYRAELIEALIQGGAHCLCNCSNVKI